MTDCKNCRALEKTFIHGRGLIANEVRYNCALGQKIKIINDKPCSENCQEKTTKIKKMRPEK